MIADRPTVDSTGLERGLRAAVRGEVRFDTGSRALYATDASNYRQVPIGVVLPRDPQDAVAAIEVCRRFAAPVFSRGGGTSLAGECCNVAVVLDWSKYAGAVESIDSGTGTAIVQPGIVLDALNKATKRHGGLVFGPRPSTHSHCTIGGMVGNNSCGSTAQWSGTTAANVHRLEILLYDGTRMWVGETTDEEYARIQAQGGRPAEVYRRLREFRDRYAERIREGFPKLPRRISGFNLPALLPEHGFHVARALVGSESTCVTVLRAEVKLLRPPKLTAMVLAGYSDIAAAADRVLLVNEHQPHALEGLDDKLINYQRSRGLNPAGLRELPDGGAWLMVELGGDSQEEAAARVRRLAQALREEGGLTGLHIVEEPERAEELWAVREVALGVTARVAGMPDTWPGWEDSAVPPERLGAYLRDFQKQLTEYGYEAASLYGHFGHGCLHVSIPFDLVTARGVADYRRFVEQAAHLVVSHGGSLSGEHGDGQSRGELLSIMYGDDLVAAFREFKAIFDPDNRMNPGKVVGARPIDANLRLGTDYAPPVVDTWFDYPNDGSFARATTRCFGVGKCRRDGGEGVMCPSYIVTREEQHSTRGRARLLFEMMQGDVITDGWRSQEVRESLDLCLACKGCRSDCPVNVDMATYKAEFLAHHFAGRLRPRSHYSLGWLPLWAQLALPVSALANAATHAPGLDRLAKVVAGIDPQREVPRFARRSFVDAYRRRGPRGSGQRGSVLLWPDSFTNAFAPHIAASTVTVLEAAGFRVLVPPRAVCCGLTWISTGQLGVARRVLRRSVQVLARYLRAGLSVVGLEPSCTSVLRSEGVDLLGPDLDMWRLHDQTLTLAELLAQRAPEFAPQLSTAAGQRPAAIVQTHCHQHADLGFGPDTEVLKRAGLDAEVLDSGCCGLAGDFGMTPEHRNVSLACAERVLLPAVRDASPETIVLADGFSCRIQIDGAGTGRRAVHLAEVLAAAVRGEQVGRYPERTLLGNR